MDFKARGPVGGAGQQKVGSDHFAFADCSGDIVGGHRVAIGVDDRMWKATPTGDAVLRSFFLTHAAGLPVQPCRATAGLNLDTSVSTPEQLHDRPPAHTRRRLSGTSRRATSLLPQRAN